MVFRSIHDLNKLDRQKQKKRDNPKGIRPVADENDGNLKGWFNGGIRNNRKVPESFMWASPEDGVEES